MKADEAVKAIEQIVEGAGTKAYRARKLFELGCDRTDVVDLLDMSYSQAHNIWKKDGYGQEQEEDQEGHTAGNASNRGIHAGSVRRRVRSHGDKDSDRSDEGGRDRSVEPRGRMGPTEAGVRLSSKRSLRLSPSQTRFITQDGHVIVRVDKADGAVCKRCDRSLTFSLRYLGFIHTASANEPTDMEDRYE